MKTKACLAIDMGASSIRFTIGYLINNIFELKEIYRFENKPTYLDGHNR